MGFGTILLIIIVVGGAFAIMAYNSLVHLRQRVGRPLPISMCRRSNATTSIPEPRRDGQRLRGP